MGRILAQLFRSGIGVPGTLAARQPPKASLRGECHDEPDAERWQRRANAGGALLLALVALVALHAFTGRAWAITYSQPAQSETKYTVGMLPPNTYMTGTVSMTVPSTGVGFGNFDLTANGALGFDIVSETDKVCCDSHGQPFVETYSFYDGLGDFAIEEPYPFTTNGTFTTCDPIFCFHNDTGSVQPITIDITNFSAPGAPPVTVVLNYSILPYVPPKTVGDPCDTAGGCTAGNPINPATGNKYEQVTDYQTSGQNKLEFTRYYNSSGGGYVAASTLGSNWRSVFDRYIQIIPSFSSTVAAERPDGQVLRFTGSGGVWTPDSDIDVSLVQSGSTWTLTDSDDTVETYTQVGATLAVPTSIKARNGYTQTLTYNGSNQLTSVADSYGRTLSFTYQNGLLNTVTTPDGLVLTYGYSVAAGSNVLASVGYSTSPTTSQTYLYENGTFPLALTGIIDENGNRFATWTYDGSGRALTSQHAGGADLTTIAYNDTDGSRTITNALGEQEVYKFTVLQGVPKLTEIDRLATATTVAAKRFFTYDANGYLASQTDWNGNRTTYINDAHGQPTTITEAAGTPQQRVTTTTYLSSFHLPSQIVGPRSTTNFAYDAAGNLLTRTVVDTTQQSVPYNTFGQSRTWTYTWTNSLLASTKGPRGPGAELTQYGYDASGALVSTTNALGQVTHITQHLPGGLPQTIVDPNGVTTQRTYDTRQRLLTSTLQGGTPLTTSYSYDAAGNLTRKTLPDGSALTFSYDAAHRLTTIADLANRRVNYTLDALGDHTLTQILGGAGGLRRTGSASFDALGRVRQNIGGANQTTIYAYDNNGNVLTVTDPRGLVTQQKYDALNRKIQITQPNGAVTAFQYNPSDQVNMITDPNGNPTTYIYDGFGDLIEEVSPDRGTTVYSYNPGALLTQRVDAAGAVMNQTWDLLDRLATTSYPADPAENVAYSYDQGTNGIGHLTGVTDAAGALSVAYNVRGLVISQTRTHGAATRVTKYTYDLANRLQSITYPSGLVASYTRDNMGQIIAVSAQPGGGASLPVVSNIAYAPFGPPTAISYGDGSVETRTLDLDYRLTGLAAPPLQNLTYAYDADDNVTSISDGVTPANSQSLGYNKVNRLNAATGGYGAIAYNYDLVGNRTNQTTTVGAMVTQSYAYVPHSNRLAEVASSGNPVHQFTYSPTGTPSEDERSGGTLDFTYNQANRLAAVEQGGTVTGQYTYDAVGERLIKSVLGGTTLYTYDQAGHLIEEDALVSSSASPQADYLYLGDQPVGLYLPGKGLYYYHDDRLGTPQRVTDGAQHPVWTGNYQPFGPVSISAAIIQNLRLPGQYADAETGWSHNGFRTYAQGLGRYIEPDPIGLDGGLNPYAYAEGNPVRYVDPMGLQAARDCNCLIYNPRPKSDTKNSRTEPKRPLDMLGIFHGRPAETFEFELKLIGLGFAADPPESWWDFIADRFKDLHLDLADKVVKDLGEDEQQDANNWLNGINDLCVQPTSLRNPPLPNPRARRGQPGYIPPVEIQRFRR